MKNSIAYGLCLLFLIAYQSGVEAQSISKNKKTVIESVEFHKRNLIHISDKIWEAAETAFEEHKSAKLLADYAEAQGFKVERHLAEMPTAFTATFGEGKPIIGVMGEFDALPALSQKALPTKDPVEVGKPGHGCGHNLFGAGSLGAAIAVKELIKSGAIKGTVRFYGTPAEERFFGKLWMAKAGLFDDLDVCLDWHPSAEISANVQSSQALVDFIVEYYGQAAHAAADPWNGRSAVDAMELFTHGMNLMREHVKPTVRIHYDIMHAGDVVNVVPEYAKIWTRVRDAKRDGMLETYERVKLLAEGAAFMTETTYKITLVSGLHEVLVNRTGGQALQKNLELLGPISYSDDETAFGKLIQEATGKEMVGMDGAIHPLKETAPAPRGGSTDVGDISWVVPEIRLGVTTAPKDTPWHSWAVVACGGMSIGHKGLVFAAKALAMTMVDLYENPKLVEDIKKEFKEKKGDAEWIPIIPEGPPPVPGN